jgi:CRISPR/Cas system-associated endoribonuclease Cas2
VIVVVAYDIVDDGRREDIASLLSGYGRGCSCQYSSARCAFKLTCRLSGRRVTSAAFPSVGFRRGLRVLIVRLALR